MKFRNNSYDKLMINSFLFALGNFGSKLISFVMLPIYTKYLTQADYGSSDLVMTTVSLLLPVASLSIFDAVLRFGMYKDSNFQRIISNGFFITLVGSVILLIFYPILLIFQIKYAFFLIIILIVNLFQSLFSQFAKSINQVKLFAVNGMVLSFITAFLNFLFLAVYQFGITGFLASNFIAVFLSNIFLIVRLNVFKEISYKSTDFKLLKEMIHYSVPLIPNSVALWVNNVANRYFILFFLGTTFNGIFAVSNKIPTLLGVVNSIFFQAWQMSAIETYEEDDKSEFYSNIFSLYSKLLFIATAVLFLFLKTIVVFFVDEKFYSSWEYIPLLLFVVLFSSFSGFLGQYYIAAMDTKGVFVTTLVGAMTNLILNAMLIPRLGLYGAGISSMISFLFLWLYRIIDTKKFVDTKYDWGSMLVSILILLFQATSLYLNISILYFYVIQVSFVIIIVFINRSIITSILLRINKK